MLVGEAVSDLPEVAPGSIVFEFYKGPDDLRRYHFAMFWRATYHPGDPKGEHRDAVRGQHFFADPKPYQDDARSEKFKVVEIDRRGERK